MLEGNIRIAFVGTMLPNEGGSLHPKLHGLMKRRTVGTSNLDSHRSRSPKSPQLSAFVNPMPLTFGPVAIAHTRGTGRR